MLYLYANSDVLTDNENIQSTDEDEEKIDENDEENINEEISRSDQSELDDNNVGIKQKKGLPESYNIYSKATKNVREDIEKGESIRNQLGKFFDLVLLIFIEISGIIIIKCQSSTGCGESYSLYCHSSNMCNVDLYLKGLYITH